MIYFWWDNDGWWFSDAAGPYSHSSGPWREYADALAFYSGEAIHEQ